MAARGLDQRGPMERLVKIAAVLKRAGDRGVPGERLAEIAEFTGEHRADQLKREIRHLSNQGWQIDNIADEGFPAVYRMSTVDNRLRVKLSAAQQRALQRAVLLANRADLAQRLGLPVSEAPLEVDAALPLEGHGEALDTVVRAVGSGALLRYRYNGTERIVHPQSVRTQNGKWYLRGREDTGDVVKSFVVSRMSDVHADEPGSATPVPAERHHGLHPMSWELDPPVEVTLRAPSEYAPDVRRWLGTPDEEHVDGGSTVLRYTVTNRAALRSRLYELGPRVEVLGPEEVRGELLDELRSLAGGAS